MHIAVLGAGAWGTALASAFARKHAVTLWGRDVVQMARIAQTRTNEKYLSDCRLPERVVVTSDLRTATAKSDLVLIVSDTSGLASLVAQLDDASPPVVWACKGFDRTTGLLPHQTVASRFGERTRYGVLSGPSFADEVAKGLPCALTLAANDDMYASALAADLNDTSLRVYSSTDLIGVELGGALKNVMAIAAGMCDGMQLGLNARAALITRGLAEMVRLGVAMGGRAETFMGLTGVGDLILTATGNLSRNRKVGMLLASGKPLDVILRELGHVAEGVNSAATARRLANTHQVSMPITEAVNDVLFGGVAPKQALSQLLAREARAEHAA
jgi:glycerol-3-phosphate dehydrogenase (NAD(P)+)